MPDLACTPAIMQHKRCPRCGANLPFSAFNRNRRTKDGRQTYCRTCCHRAARFLGRLIRDPAITLWQADAWTAVA
jgi:hypothetical protein